MSQTDSLNNFTVGEIEVSPQHNTLRHASRVITLQPKVMAVLYYLAQNQTRVVGNDELLQSVWSGRVVTLASVQKSINALRSALAELAYDQEFVAYFSKRGYQLMMPVTWHTAEGQLPPEPVEAPPKEEPSNQATTSESSQSAPELTSNQIETAALASLPAAEITAPGINSYKFGSSKSLLLTISLALAALAIALFYPSHGRQSSPVSDHPSVTASASNSNQPTPSQIPTPVPAWQSITTYLPASANAHHTTPNPDGKRAAYLRESELADGAHQSDLMIRDNTGLDWLLARSNSTWVDLAWSPSGRALAALEIYRADGVFSEPNFYQTPQYLYNFHLFTLDLKGQHLLEKNLLSQWQGKVNSITWWDENTLEFVATMGANVGKERYRYGITDQTLTALGPSTSGFQPVVSRVRDKITVLISQRNENSQVEFLDEEQQLIGRQPIESGIFDLAWAPDSKAVFALDTHLSKIMYLPILGTPTQSFLPSPLNDTSAGSLSDLKLDSTGKLLYLTAITQTTPLYKYSLQGLKHLTDINQYVNRNKVAYAPTGDSIIYASQQNGRSQLWQLNQNKTEALYKMDGQIQNILWASADILIIKANNSLVSFQLNTRQLKILVKDAQDLEPLSYAQTTQTLLVIKSVNDVRNIWRINVDTQQSKQLTFGEVGSARSWNDIVYFQYANQRGLWKLNTQDPNHTAINDQLPQHSQLLGKLGENVFFVTGGPCHESDVQQLNLLHNTLSTFLKRQDNTVVSFELSANQRILQSKCNPINYTSYEVRAP